MSQLPNIDSIAIKQSERKAYLTQLLTSLIQSGYQILIISKKHKRKFDGLLLKSGSEQSVYVVSGDSVNEGVDLLYNTTPWHRGIFCVVIGQGELISNFDKLELNELSKSIDEINVKIDNLIDGYFFPLDDELVFYGNESIAEEIGNL
ncbi:MAG: hypothetical protein R3F48_01050 [Candidatus Zixiibacteriota bacterium]